MNHWAIVCRPEGCRGEPGSEFCFARLQRALDHAMDDAVVQALAREPAAASSKKSRTGPVTLLAEPSGNQTQFAKPRNRDIARLRRILDADNAFNKRMERRANECFNRTAFFICYRAAVASN